MSIIPTLLKKIAVFSIIILSFNSSSFALISAVEEEDGSPLVFPWKVKFPNGNVTDNGDGTVSIADQTGAGGGDSVSIDSVAVVDPDFVSTGQIDFVNTANTVTANINDDSILEADLKAVNAAVDEDILTYESTTGDYEWHTPAELSLQPLEATLTDIADGTIAEDLVNTANPWADNEVADTITAGNVEGTDFGTLTDTKFCTYDLAGTEIDCTSDGGSGAPTDADYLVGTANGSLSAEIVVGTSPGGELGGTWASPTLDDSVTTTGWVMGTFSGTSLTTGSMIMSDGLLDGVGAVDMDYGSADITDHTFTTDGTGTAEFVIPAGGIDSTEILDDTIVNADINSSAAIALSKTAITAGRSLTIATNDIAADAETYTDAMCFRITSPTGTDFQSAWVNRTGKTFTVTDLWCESDQTVTMMTQVDDGSVADMDTVDLVCISTPDTDASLDGDATVANGDRVDIDVASVASTPTWVTFCMTGEYAD